jgi:hypothetical protein
MSVCGRIRSEVDQFNCLRVALINVPVVPLAPAIRPPGDVPRRSTTRPAALRPPPPDRLS